MNALAALVAAELATPVAPEVADFAAAVAGRHGDASLAVLFYGSCLWADRLDGLMLDFYLVVDDYAAAYAGAWLARANALVPPNVFYAEHGALVAKYAVLTLADLDRLCGPETRSVSVWARFAQPSRLAWVRDEGARRGVVAAVARAAPTLLVAARPLLPRQVGVVRLWTEAFALTYTAELRTERAARGQTLFDAQSDRYRRFTAPALEAAGLAARIEGDALTFVDDADARAGARAWAMRRRHGKLMSLVRLVKASFTFDGGIDYLAWKIERHSGTRVTVRPWMRKVPIAAGLWLLPQLVRRGAVR